jgi:hypothetical protein
MAVQWITLSELREAWEDAPMDDVRLQSMLDAAQVQAAAYAPVLPVGTPVPANYREGLILQVRSVWEAGVRNGDVIGYGDGYAVRVRPLGVDVKALLRPKRAIPVAT